MASLLFDSGARSLCHACTNVSRSATRLFNSSAKLTAGYHSPNYIDIPKTLQTDHPIKPKVKGVLPVPRELFPKRRPDKATPEYISEVTPEPTTPGIKKVNPRHAHQDKEYIEWKQKIAEVRRQNLREGLTELHTRKQKSIAEVARQSDAKLKYREQVLTQPPRDDERLTRASIVHYKVQPLSKGDVNRALQLSRNKVEKAQKRKKQERKDALHSLYMNARHFVINEEQLMKEIDTVFPAGENPAWTTDRSAGANIWHQGAPPTVEIMIRQMHNAMSQHEVVQKRTKKMAEALTGGKI